MPCKIESKVDFTNTNKTTLNMSDDETIKLPKPTKKFPDKASVFVSLYPDIDIDEFKKIANYQAMEEWKNVESRFKEETAAYKLELEQYYVQNPDKRPKKKRVSKEAPEHKRPRVNQKNVDKVFATIHSSLALLHGMIEDVE